MPIGALAGSGTVFGMVGRKFALADGGSGAEATTEELAVAECVEAAFRTVMPPSNATVPATRPHAMRLGETTGEDLMTLFFLPIFLRSRLGSRGAFVAFGGDFRTAYLSLIGLNGNTACMNKAFPCVVVRA